MALSAKVESIIHEVEALSEGERNELMRALDGADDSEVNSEWQEEIHRRVREIEEGKVELISEEDFLCNLRAV